MSTEKSSAGAKQEVLQFEPVNRGRFEKSEPTIVEGEDLDVPDLSAKKNQSEVTTRKPPPSRSEVNRIEKPRRIPRVSRRIPLVIPSLLLH